MHRKIIIGILFFLSPFSAFASITYDNTVENLTDADPSGTLDVGCASPNAVIVAVDNNIDSDTSPIPTVDGQTGILVGMGHMINRYEYLYYVNNVNSGTIAWSFPASTVGIYGEVHFTSYCGMGALDQFQEESDIFSDGYAKNVTGAVTDWGVQAITNSSIAGVPNNVQRGSVSDSWYQDSGASIGVSPYTLSAGGGSAYWGGVTATFLDATAGPPTPMASSTSATSTDNISYGIAMLDGLVAFFCTLALVLVLFKV